MDAFEHDTATLAASPEETLVGNTLSNGVSAEPSQLQFTYDNPSNTTLLDMTGNTLYTVKTSNEPAMVTVLKRVTSGAAEEELFSLEWHDILSDKISIRGNRSVSFSSILSPVLPLSSSRKFTYDGKSYRWSNLMKEPRLFVEGIPDPMARFQKSQKVIPPHIQAMLKNVVHPRPASMILDPWILSNPGLLDMILITFLPMEKTARMSTGLSSHQMMSLMLGATGS